MTTLDLFSSVEPEAPKTCGNCGYRAQSIHRGPSGEACYYCMMSFRDVAPDTPACRLYEVKL